MKAILFFCILFLTFAMCRNPEKIESPKDEKEIKPHSISIDTFHLREPNEFEEELQNSLTK